MEFRKIKEVPYEVGENGLIRHVSTKKFLKAFECKWGYLHVAMKLPNCIKRKVVSVHRIVADVFVENTYNKPTVNHIDRNKKNNHWRNLEWQTKEEQKEHARNTIPYHIR